MITKAPKKNPKGSQKSTNGPQDVPKTLTENQILVLPACSLSRSSARSFDAGRGWWDARQCMEFVQLWRGTKTSRTWQNLAGASKGMAPRVGPRVRPRTGHGDLARRPRRGGGYARGASHQPDPAPDARSDGRASREADSTLRPPFLRLGDRFGSLWGPFLESWGSFWGALGAIG